MRYLYLTGYAAIPVAFLVHFLIGSGVAWEPVVTFGLAALGVIPLAHLMGNATEHLAEETGPTWGGLLNATFGNAAELIIGIIALSKGFNDIVKASLTGSILGNLLLVSGAAMVFGGWKREEQTFNKDAMQADAGLLVVAVAAMLFPAIFHFTYRGYDAQLLEHEHNVSIGTSIILLLVYGAGLLFTLKTHSHIFSRAPSESPEDPPGLSGIGERWSVKKSVLVLLGASVGIALISEVLVGSADAMAQRLGWNHVFVGVILLAIIGNAAEHSTAVLLARRNDMDTAMAISHQSSIQIALFAVPVLVLLSTVFTSMHIGNAHHLDLLFSPLEVVGVMLAVLIIVVLGLDGTTNWFEGVLLLAVYLILGIAFFYIPASAPHRYDVHTAVPIVDAPPLMGDSVRHE